MVALLAEGDVSGVDAHVQLRRMLVFCIHREGPAQSDFGGVELRSGNRADRLLRTLAQRNGPGIIAGLGLDVDSFSFTRNANLVKLAVPVALRRVVSDLVADADVVHGLFQRAADILARVRPSSDHTGELIQSRDALHASAGDAGG